MQASEYEQSFKDADANIRKAERERCIQAIKDSCLTDFYKSVAIAAIMRGQIYSGHLVKTSTS